MTVLNTGHEYINVDGLTVEKDALSIAERLAEYDPNLVILCLNADSTSFTDAPFILAEKCPDGELRRVFEFWELNASILERVELADTTKHDIQAKIDYINAQVTKSNKQKYKEKKLEILERGMGLLKSKTTAYSFPVEEGIMTVSDNKPAKIREHTHGDNRTHFT